MPWSAFVKVAIFALSVSYADHAAEEKSLSRVQDLTAIRPKK